MTDAYEKNVFLNYPYEVSHQPIVDAMVFSVLASGFTPRSAEEDIGGLALRIDRIVRIISECQHGVHDLSSSTASGDGRPRLNMPFELGIFYGAMRLGSDSNRSKQGFVFDEEPHRNHTSFSDSSGLDLQAHKRQPIVALIIINRYLSARSVSKIGVAQLAALFVGYVDALPEYCSRHDLILEHLSFSERRGLIVSWLQEEGRKTAI